MVVCLIMAVHPAVAVPRLRMGVVATVAMVLEDPTMAMVVMGMAMAMAMAMGLGLARATRLLPQPTILQMCIKTNRICPI